MEFTSLRYPCYIQFNQSGRCAVLVHKNQRVIAEILLHSALSGVTEQIHRSRNGEVIEPVRLEAFELGNNERIENDQIVEPESSNKEDDKDDRS